MVSIHECAWYASTSNLGAFALEVVVSVFWPKPNEKQQSNHVTNVHVHGRQLVIRRAIDEVSPSHPKTFAKIRPSLTLFEVAHLGFRDSPILGFSCSYSCSVDDGARARIRSFEDDNEHHFIEHEHDFLSRSLKSATSKLTRRVGMYPTASRL
jgi:hypothetical protein